jgi:hypothetical protein
MRHATQERFDRVARGELQRPAYTVEQMLRWTETDLNWHMREALRAQSYRALHIREASETGVFDLLVYAPGGMIAGGEYKDQVIHAWIELKVENSKADSNVRSSQREFGRDHWQAGRNAIFVMIDRKVGMLAAHQGDLKGRVKMLPLSPYSVDWQAVIAHFKARR